MPDVAALYIKVDSQGVVTASRRLSELDAAGKKAEGSTDRLGKSAQRMGGMFHGAAGQVLGMIGRVASLAALVATVTKLGTASLSAASSFERLQAEFGIMARSAAGGKAIFEAINDFAARTPLQLEQIAEVSKMLMSFGTSARELLPTLQMLGDASLGNAEKMERLARAYGRVQARGRASMEEVNMAMEAGLPIIDEMAKVLGVTNDRVFKLVAEGKVGFEDFRQAFRNMTGEAGQFYQGMGTLADTLQGKWSTMLDNLRLLGATMVEEALPGIKRGIDAVTQAAGFLTQVFKFDKAGEALKILGKQFLEFLRVITSPEFQQAAGAALRDLMIAIAKSLVQGIFGLFTGLYQSAIRVADRLGEDWWKYVVNAITRIATGGSMPNWLKGFLGLEGYEGWQPFKVAGPHLGEIIRQELLRTDMTDSVLAAGGTIITGVSQALVLQVTKLKALLDAGMASSAEDWAKFKGELEALQSQAEAERQRILSGIPSTAPAAAPGEGGGTPGGFRPSPRDVPSWDELNPQVDDYTRRLIEQAAVLEERLGPAQMNYNRELAHLNALAPYVTAQAYENALAELEERYRSLWEPSRLFFDELKNIGQQLGRMALEGVLDVMQEIGGALEKGSFSAKSFGESIGQMVLQLLNALPTLFLTAGLNIIATNPSMWPIGLALIAAAGVTALAAGWANSYVGSAHGNVFENGRLMKMAKGGFVDRPSMFPMANGQMGMAGEAGIEAIMPVRRLANGDLGVQAGGGRGGTTVNVYNYSQEQVETKQREKPTGEKEIDVIVGTAVQRQIASGALDKSFKANYGLERRGQRI